MTAILGLQLLRPEVGGHDIDRLDHLVEGIRTGNDEAVHIAFSCSSSMCFGMTNLPVWLLSGVTASMPLIA